MQRRKSNNIAEQLYNKIVTVAYGDGTWLDKLHIYYMISVDAEIKTLFKSLKETADDVHKLEVDQFPEELLHLVERKTIPVKSMQSSFAGDFLSIIIARPVVSLATTLVLITAMISSLFINREANSNFSDDEILKADKQARYALTIVNKIFSQTNSTLKDDVLTDRVSKPINDGVSFINNLLEGDKK